MPKKSIYKFDKKLGKLFLLLLTREILRNSGEDLFRFENLPKRNETDFSKTNERDNKKDPFKEITNLSNNRKDSPIKNPQPLYEKPLKNIPGKEIQETPEKNLQSVLKREKNIKPQKPVNIAPPKRAKTPKRIPVLRIPTPKLPRRFQYLKPVPTEKEIDLGNKINSFIRNPSIREIECLGPNQEINVYGAMGRQTTDITLSKEEIDRIIEKFSIESKIPTFDGVFRVVVGKLVLSAMISSQQGSRFVIRKIQSPRPPQGRRM